MTRRKTIAEWGERITLLSPEVLGNTRPIPDTDGRYRIDRSGNVLSTAHLAVPDGYAWKLRPARSRIAYPINRVKLWFCGDSGARLVSVSRLVLLAWVGPPPTPHHQACHLNGIGTDDRLENLEWRTPVGVKRRSIERGTWVHGERVHTARHTPERIRAIRRLLDDYNVPVNLLATALGETQARVQEVATGTSWGGKPKALARSGAHSKMDKQTNRETT